MTHIAMKIGIEIVLFPIKHGDFHSYVKLPESSALVGEVVSRAFNGSDGKIDFLATAIYFCIGLLL